MQRTIIQTSAILFTLFFFSQCYQKHAKQHIDEFYTNKEGIDERRIPLIKPYEATIVSSAAGWIANLQGYALDFSVPNVKKVGIANNCIFLYSTDTIFNGKDASESWYIINPVNHIEKGFLNHNNYIKYLKKLNFEKEPMLMNINEVATYFDNHDTIDWKNIR